MKWSERYTLEHGRLDDPVDDDLGGHHGGDQSIEVSHPSTLHLNACLDRFTTSCGPCGDLIHHHRTGESAQEAAADPNKFDIRPSPEDLINQGYPIIAPPLPPIRFVDYRGGGGGDNDDKDGGNENDVDGRVDAAGDGDGSGSVALSIPSSRRVDDSSDGSYDGARIHGQVGVYHVKHREDDEDEESSHGTSDSAAMAAAVAAAAAAAATATAGRVVVRDAATGQPVKPLTAATSSATESSSGGGGSSSGKGSGGGSGGGDSNSDEVETRVDIPRFELPEAQPPPRRRCGCSSASSFFIPVLLLGVIALGATAVLWYGEYSLFRKPIDQKTYATCGGCHCIPSRNDTHNGTCPMDDEVPRESYDSDTIETFRSQICTNPHNVICDPYREGGCISPIQDAALVASESTVCGILYERPDGDGDDAAARGRRQCPSRYRLETYANESEAEEDGAVVTHAGACGVCSTTKDLAAYMTNRNMVDSGTRCGAKVILGEEGGLSCFRDLGFTEDCAQMWVYNSLNTKDKCSSLCLEAYASRWPNNGPEPDCALNNCLQCDEDLSGPTFKRYAGRTRRRSGLLSAIVRSCDDLALITHESCPRFDVVEVTLSPTLSPSSNASEGTPFPSSLPLSAPTLRPTMMRLTSMPTTMAFSSQEPTQKERGTTAPSLHASRPDGTVSPTKLPFSTQAPSLPDGVEIVEKPLETLQPTSVPFSVGSPASETTRTTASPSLLVAVTTSESPTKASLATSAPTEDVVSTTSPSDIGIAASVLAASSVSFSGASPTPNIARVDTNGT